MPRAKRVLLHFLCFMLCISACICPISASEDVTAPPSLHEASAVSFYHVESQTVVLEKNADTAIPAGSSVKVMAGLLFCEAFADRLYETVEITDEMVAQSAGYRLYLRAGDVLTVEQLLYAALCASYNDAYDVLAVQASGSRAAFVAEMNARATMLGCNNSVFTDPSGVDDSSQTDASDLLLIARTAFENELYMQLSSTLRYSFGGSQLLSAKTFYNRNALLSKATTAEYFNAKCRGMSAGYTETGGSCVITAAVYEEQTYLCIVMGARETDGTNYGYVLTNRIIKWGFDAFEYVEILTPETVVCMIPVTVSDMTTEVEARVGETLICFLPKGIDPNEFKYSIRLLCNELEAPFSEGKMVGYVSVLYQGKALGVLPLYTAGGAERSAFVSTLHAIRGLLHNRAFVSGTMFFCVVLCAWIVTETVLQRRRRLKWDKYFSMKMDPAPNSLQNTNKNRRPPRS